MWLNELWRRWMGQAPRQLRRRGRPSRLPKRLTLEALEERTLLSAPVSTTDGLIAAINAANLSGTPTTIALSANTTFDFTKANNSTNGANALPVIAANITITGSGGDVIERSTASGTPAFRLFDVASGGSLTLQNLALQDGLAQGTGTAAEGGAVYSSGILALGGVTVQSNKVQGNDGANGGLAPGAGGNGANAFGGGLYVAGGSVSLTSSTLISNNVFAGFGGRGANVGKGVIGGTGGTGGEAEGGGLYVAGGNVSLSNDNLSGNHAFGGTGGFGGNGGFGGRGGTGGKGAGGGLYVAGGHVSLSNDNLSGNHAFGGSGGTGGIGSLGGSGGNGGAGGDSAGGGLFVTSAGSITLNNDTVSGNSAAAGFGGTGGTGGSGRHGGNGGDGGASAGGGLDVTSTNLTLNGDTLSGNSAVGGNGGAGGGSSNVNSGNGGNGGSGGNGGQSAGGGLNVGSASSVILNSDTFSNNDAFGGAGGAGTHGGFGGSDSGGNGGVGGDGAGGGLNVELVTTLTLSNGTLSGDSAQGGVGGSGGFGIVNKGGDGGNGGASAGGGLNVQFVNIVTLSNDSLGENAVNGGNGGNGGGGGAGGNGGNGGTGGSGSGGGLYTGATSTTLLADTLSDNIAKGGHGGNGNGGGLNGTGNHGGSGGSGGGGGGGFGGGLFVAQGSVTLTNDTISNNLVVGNHGGNGGNGGTDFVGTFQEGGTAGGGGNGGVGGAGAGGGLYVAVGSVSLLNDTVYANTVFGGDGGNGGAAGNVFISSIFLTFVPSSLPGNGGFGGASLGGGIFALANNTALVLANTLIVEDAVLAGLGGIAGGQGNYDIFPGAPGATGPTGGVDVSAAVKSSDHDLIGDPSGSRGFGNSGSGDLLNVNADLGPLQNNGGPTQTMALLSNSPAIDAGDSHAPGLPATDQRGFARIVGKAVDIGAFEFQAATLVTHVSLSGTATSGVTSGGQIVYQLTVTNTSSTTQSHVVLTDQLPTSTTLVSWTPAAGWNNDAPAAGSDSGTATAWIASLAANSSATCTLVVQVNNDTPVGTVITDTFSVGPVADASNPGASSVSFTTTVLNAPTVKVADAGGIYNGNPFPATASAVGTDGATPVAGTFSYAYYAGTSASGTPLNYVPVNAGTYTVVATFTSSDPNYGNGSAQTTFTIAQATAALSNLTVQQILVGTTATTVSGLLTSNTIALPIGQSVAIALNGVTQYATVATNGSFSVSFDTSAFGVGTYPIRYSYAGDVNFTPVSGTGSLTVAYGSQLLFDNSKPKHSGAVLPVKLALTDANGSDISSANIAVAAVGLVDANGNAVSLNAAGNANPNDLFRYDAGLGGYIFNLSTKGLAAGTYTLYFTAGNDPTRHSLTFVVD